MKYCGKLFIKKTLTLFSSSTLHLYEPSPSSKSQLLVANFTFETNPFLILYFNSISSYVGILK